MKVCLAVVFLVFISAAHAAQIKGTVVSTPRGEPLRQVRISVLEQKTSVVTGDNGVFVLPQLSPGRYTLQVVAVGYRLVNTSFEIVAENDDKDFSITLVPDNLRRTESVEVKGDIFQQEDTAAPSQMNLNARELKEAGTVAANDPFRSVESLPGVSASDNNDFFGQFSVWGAPFSNVGVYLDNVVVPQPFNTIPGFRDGASLSVFSGNTIADLTLLPVAYPVRFGEDNGAALSLTTREGSRTRPHFSVSTGLTLSEVLGEGGLGTGGKGSWLASARKSYLNAYYQHRGGDPDVNVGFQDADVKLNYDLSRSHAISLYLLTAHTDLDQTIPDANADSLISGGNDFDVGRVGWRYTVTPQLLLDTQGAYIRQRFDTRNPSGQILTTDYYGEWVGGTRAVWNWRRDHVMEAGYTLRRLRDAGYGQDFFNGEISLFGQSDLTALRQSGYAQQASSFFSNRLRLMAGVRWDQVSHVDFQPVSTQVSAAWQAASHTQVQFGYARFAQLPELSLLGANCVVPLPADIPPQTRIADVLSRSDHYSMAVEQRLGETVRVRVEGFDRQNGTLEGTRVLSQSGCSPIETDSRFTNTVVPNYSRGMQVMLQRRSANRLSGWAGYTLAYSRMQLPLPGANPFNPAGAILVTPTLVDQRHTLNAFGMYRLTSTVNLSAKFLYGSGFPFNIENFVIAGNTFLSAGPAHDSIGHFERLDVRVDKAWVFSQWKMTLYAEGLNLTNHNNPRLLAPSFDPMTGRATALTAKGLPIAPTAGLTFEF